MRGEGVCDRCGHDYPVWSAPSDIWNLVVRAHGGDGYGDEANRDVFLCPTCFTRLGAERAVAPMWLVTPEIGGPINLARQIVLIPDADEAGERFASLGALFAGRISEVELLVIDDCVSSMGEFTREELEGVAERAERLNADGWLGKMVREYLNVWREIGERP